MVCWGTRFAGGGALDLYNAGVSPERICIAGRWTSNCWKIYVTLSQSSWDCHKHHQLAERLRRARGLNYFPVGPDLELARRLPLFSAFALHGPAAAGAQRGSPGACLSFLPLPPVCLMNRRGVSLDASRPSGSALILVAGCDYVCYASQLPGQRRAVRRFATSTTSYLSRRQGCQRRRRGTKTAATGACPAPRSAPSSCLWTVSGQATGSNSWQEASTGTCTTRSTLLMGRLTRARHSPPCPTLMRWCERALPRS